MAIRNVGANEGGKKGKKGKKEKKESNKSVIWILGTN